MPGCFGIVGNAPRFPTDKLVEAVPRIDIWELQKLGGLVEGAETFVQIAGGDGLCLRRMVGNLDVGGTRVAIAFDEPIEGCVRAWFECPLSGCGRRRRHLYILRDRIACRTCAGPLDYQCRHRYRSIGGLNKVLALRGKIRAGPPFTAIERRPRRYRRYWRIVAEVRRLEDALVGHCGEIANVLERRYDRS